MAKRAAEETPDLTDETVDRLTQQVLVSSADDVPDEITPEDAEDDEEPGPSRDEKKKSRWTANVERATAAEAEAERLRTEVATERAARLALESVSRQPAQPQTYQDPLKAYDDAEAQIVQEIENHRKTYAKMDAKQLTEEDANRFHSRWQELDGHLQRTRINREVHRNNLIAQQNAPNPKATAAVNHIRTNYADLADDENAMQLVNGLVIQKTAMRNARNRTPGAPASMAELDEALQETRKSFGKGPARPTTPARAAAYSGVPSGPSQSTKKNGSLNMTGQDGKVYHQLAQARWPKLYAADPKKALGKLAAELAED